MADTRAQFGVLGPVQLSIDGVQRSVGGPKQRAVLAYLVVNANHPVSVDALAQAVWEQTPPSDVRASLHAITSNLRKPLRDAGLDARAVLAQVGAGYRIAVADGACDVHRFRARKESGLRDLAAGRFSSASEALSGALGQWRGPVLADLRGLGFADAYAAALDDERIGVIEARASADIARGHANDVAAELALIVGAHPLREPLWEKLITALYLSGRQSDALAAVRRLRTTLDDELGIDPGPAIHELEARILRQEPLSARTVADATVTRWTTIIEQSVAGARAELRDTDGTVYPLAGSVTRIGRLPDNDIVLEHGKVSRQHAVLVDNGSSFVIKDLWSSNGVYVDGERIIDSVALTDGAVLRIGGFELVFSVVPQ
ncbi:BTAD domain-containing putative transcriptional regulator [Nocardia sp. CA-119907]|uniref:BTAD domain-containing putative transcriptional regulator n=1 Tax=Nocardia sp. CA-119907 TaxID=3239973 RepID=UPI003D9701DC